MGIFGFLYNEEFATEDGVTGNWGSYDQRLALEWVNKHVHNLGGDPKKVQGAQNNTLSKKPLTES